MNGPWIQRRHSGTLLVLGLGACALLLQLVPALGARTTLMVNSFDYGQCYRLVTCHFGHWSWEHLFWSGGTFVMMGLIALNLSSTRTVLAIVGVSSLCIGCGVLISRPDLSAYNGLSGIDCALFAFVAVQRFKRAGRAGDRRGLVLSVLALLGLIAKMTVELTGVVWFASSTDMVVVPEAHLIGAAVGVVVGLWSGRIVLDPYVRASEGL